MRILPNYTNRPVIVLLAIAFFTSFSPITAVQAGELVVAPMPQPGTMIGLSRAFTPAHLKGMVVHPDNALKFDFLVQKGDGQLDEAQKRLEYNKLIKYFLAALTVPDKDQWVNLSPYEKDRIVEDSFGKTEMGRDLLGQDYLLKQITSSLMYPESSLGKMFWDKVYEKAYKELGHTNIPVNTFNKVWIMPDEAVIHENGTTAYIAKSHLKVMLEEDYLALKKNKKIAPTAVSPIVREVILPILEKEINEGKNFAQLRQVFSGMILATWYKRTLKQSLLGQIYADKAKVKGVGFSNANDVEGIYQSYLAAFKKGVYNYIKEEEDGVTHQPIPRKYFAGGFVRNDHAMTVTPVDKTTISNEVKNLDAASTSMRPSNNNEGKDNAMLSDDEFKGILDDFAEKGFDLPLEKKRWIRTYIFTQHANVLPQLAQYLALLEGGQDTGTAVRDIERAFPGVEMDEKKVHLLAQLLYSDIVEIKDLTLEVFYVVGDEAQNQFFLSMHQGGGEAEIPLGQDQAKAKEYLRFAIDVARGKPVQQTGEVFDLIAKEVSDVKATTLGLETDESLIRKFFRKRYALSRSELLDIIHMIGRNEELDKELRNFLTTDNKPASARKIRQFLPAEWSVDTKIQNIQLLAELMYQDTANVAGIRIDIGFSPKRDEKVYVLTVGHPGQLDVTNVLLSRDYSNAVRLFGVAQRLAKREQVAVDDDEIPDDEGVDGRAARKFREIEGAIHTLQTLPKPPADTAMASLLNSEEYYRLVTSFAGHRFGLFPEGINETLYQVGKNAVANAILDPWLVRYNQELRKGVNPGQGEFTIAVGYPGADVISPWLTTGFTTAFWFYNDANKHAMDKRNFVRALSSWDELNTNNSYFEDKRARGWSVGKVANEDPARHILEELKAMGATDVHVNPGHPDISDAKAEVILEDVRAMQLFFKLPGDRKRRSIIFINGNIEEPFGRMPELLRGRINAYYEKASYDTLARNAHRLKFYASWLKPGGKLIFNPYSMEDGLIEKARHAVPSGFHFLLDDDLTIRQLKNFRPPGVAPGHYGWDMDVWVDEPTRADKEAKEIEPADAALIAGEFKRGGIDFNSAGFDLVIKRDGKGLPLPVAQQDLAQLSRIGGLTATILEIRPAADLPHFKSSAH